MTWIMIQSKRRHGVLYERRRREEEEIHTFCFYRVQLQICGPTVAHRNERMKYNVKRKRNLEDGV